MDCCYNALRLHGIMLLLEIKFDFTGIFVPYSLIDTLLGDIIIHGP